MSADPARILLVEDSPSDAQLFRTLLSRALPGSEVSHVDRLGRALDCLDREEVDVILLDLSLPDSEGLATVSRVYQRASHLPIVVLTGTDDERLALRVVEAGAQDYLPKSGVNERLLKRCIRYSVQRIHAEQALREKEEQLRQAQKLEAIGTLAGGIAHEFNNLLQVIDGHANCAIEGLEPDDERYQSLGYLLSAVERAAKLTRELLGFSRRQSLEPARLDPAAVVGELVELVRPVLGEEIELSTRLGDDVAAVSADRGQLQQVLMNLCINARDAMPAGGRLQINLQNVSPAVDADEIPAELKSGPHVLLSVSDTGCGIPAEELDRIFEPFYTTKEVAGGTGLGLAMVYGIVRQHGGVVRARSQPGHGTTFDIYLPSDSPPVPSLSGGMGAGKAVSVTDEG